MLVIFGNFEVLGFHWMPEDDVQIGDEEIIIQGDDMTSVRREISEIRNGVVSLWLDEQLISDGSVELNREEMKRLSYVWACVGGIDFTKKLCCFCSGRVAAGVVGGFWVGRSCRNEDGG